MRCCINVCAYVCVQYHLTYLHSHSHTHIYIGINTVSEKRYVRYHHAGQNFGSTSINFMTDKNEADEEQAR